jgi:hypothetical protein
MNKLHGISEFAIVPDPDDERLSRAVTGVDQTGAEVEAHVVHERPLTIYLNSPGNRHGDDNRRSSGLAGRGLSAQPGHAES